MAAAAAAMAGATAAAAASAAAGATDSTDAAATALASLSLSSASASSAVPTLSKVEALERLFVRHWDDFCVQAAEQFRLKEVRGFEFFISRVLPISCSPLSARANVIEPILLETIVIRLIDPSTFSLIFVFFL